MSDTQIDGLTRALTVILIMTGIRPVRTGPSDNLWNKYPHLCQTFTLY
jgi:hypothetical protein